MRSLADSWQDIIRWLGQHASGLIDKLPGPADPLVIHRTEAEIGMLFPDDLRESFLIQDGRDYGEDELNIFPTPPDGVADMAFCLLPVAEIAAEWDVWRDLIDIGEFEGIASRPETGIRNCWWSKGWIPVAGNGGGDFICVDMDPAEGGQVGQVICAWHDSEIRQYLAPSWIAFLDSIASEMAAGTLRFAEDYGVVRAATS